MTGSLQIKNGKYYAVYRTETGSQKWVPLNLSVNGNNKRKAQQKLREVLVEAEKNKTVVTSSILFLDWVNRWMEQKKLTVSEGTFEGYTFYLQKHIIPYFKPLRLTLSELSAQHLQTYYNTKYKQGQAASTLHKHNAIIHGALAEAYKKDIIPCNPADKVTFPKKKKYHGTAYNLAEAKTLLATIEEDDPVRPAVILGLFYGLRRSEALGLRWSDIDFKAGTVFIHRTVVRMKSVHDQNTTKSESSRRRLHLVPCTVPYFQELLEKQQQNCTDMGQSFSMDNHICVWPDGKPLDPNYVSHRFRSILLKNNLPIIRFHDLRHTAGSLLLADGVDIKTIQEFLGHSDATTTANIYLHSVVQGGKITAASLNRLME